MKYCFDPCGCPPPCPPYPPCPPSPSGPTGPTGPTGPQGGAGTDGPQGPPGAGPHRALWNHGAAGPCRRPRSPGCAWAYRPLRVSGAWTAPLGRRDFPAQPEPPGPRGPQSRRTNRPAGGGRGHRAHRPLRVSGAWTAPPGRRDFPAQPEPPGHRGPRARPDRQARRGRQVPPGPPAPQGIRGMDGPTGPQGLPGPAGATGPQGPQGAAGPTGPQGAPATGPTGPAGGPGEDVFASYYSDVRSVPNNGQIPLYELLNDPTGNITLSGTQQLRLQPGYYRVSYSVSAILEAPGYLQITPAFGGLARIDLGIYFRTSGNSSTANGSAPSRFTPPRPPTFPSPTAAMCPAGAYRLRWT